MVNVWLHILPFTGHVQFFPHEYISIIYRARFHEEAEFYVLNLYKKRDGNGKT